MFYCDFFINYFLSLLTLNIISRYLKLYILTIFSNEKSTFCLGWVYITLLKNYYFCHFFWTEQPLYFPAEFHNDVKEFFSLDHHHFSVWVAEKNVYIFSNFCLCYRKLIFNSPTWKENNRSMCQSVRRHKIKVHLIFCYFSFRKSQHLLDCLKIFLLSDVFLLSFSEIQKWQLAKQIKKIAGIL